MKRKIVFIFGALLLISPIIAAAAGLVPCGGVGEEPCQLCHLVDMVNGIAKWLIMILTVVFSVIVILAGLTLVTSAGNVSAKESAKKRISSAFIGFVIVLAAWLIVDFGMRSLVEDSSSRFYEGPWNEIKCVAQPKFGVNRIYHPVPDASRGVGEGVVSPVSEAQLAILVGLNSYDEKVKQAAQDNGLDSEQVKNLQALMRVESASCSNKTSPVGALGCMQIMPDTARQYDQGLRGLSDQQVKDKLRDNDDYNIALGAEIYKDLHTKYNGDEEKIYAGYNGGPGSNSPSKDCPGQTRWQCEWDSPGCYGTGKTDCVPNTGYIETRNYVKKVAGVADKL